MGLNINVEKSLFRSQNMTKNTKSRNKSRSGNLPILKNALKSTLFEASSCRLLFRGSRAIEIGQECLNDLSPKPQKEKSRVIELSGTKKERISEAFQLAYIDVSDQEISHFKEV